MRATSAAPMRTTSSTSAPNQQAVRGSPPVRATSAAPVPTASSTSAPRVAGAGSAANRAVNGGTSRQPEGVGKKDVPQKTAANPRISNKTTNDGRETKEQTKTVKGFDVPIVKVETLLDLLKLFNRNDAGDKPMVLRSPGKITKTGIPKFDNKLPEKKPDIKKPASSTDKKLPLR